MRAALLVSCAGVMTLSRTYRPVVDAGWFETLAVLPRACTTVVQLVPSFETCRSKSRVFHVAVSPPAPAWRTVNDWIERVEPRSTRRNFVAPNEHHLSELPPPTEPFTAFSGPSFA